MVTRAKRRAAPPRARAPRAARKTPPAKPKTLTLERLLTSPNGFGLTKATPLQRVICRIADGLPFDDLLEQHPELAALLEKTCGPGGMARLPGVMPKELYLITGVRNGKSLICAAIGLKAALTVDLTMLLPWEEAVVSIVSISTKKAGVILRHLTGALDRALRPLLAREPTRSCVWIRRPQDGRIVRIEIAAGARAGGSLVSDWSAGALFDEFTRMTGEAEGKVINFDEARKAVIGRLLPGAQLVGVGSPWAPRGAAYEIVKAHWGNPSSKIVVLRPPSLAMNPFYWTEEVIEALRKSPKGEHVYRTDYLGEFADPESSFFTTAELEGVTRKNGPLVLPAREGIQYFAAIDPAMLRNAWTLVVAGREYRPDGSVRVIIPLVRQWVPGRIGPLNPEIIFAEIRALCDTYRIHEVFTDKWKSEELTVIGRKVGLTVTVYGLAGQDSVRIFDSLRLRVLTGGIDLPPDSELRTDMLAIRRVVRNRTIGMDLPFTNDGRHCDYAPSLAVANELAATSSSWINAMEKVATEGLQVFAGR
jgi:hypothetical protein